MKVFCDLHHSDLYYSLQLLFEKRLGAEMYRSIGLEWREQGFWKVYDHPATAQQYLGLNQAIEKPKDVHGNYLEGRDVLNGNYRFEDGIYYVKDPTKDKVNRAITLDKFQEMKFDIVIASIPQHIKPYQQLIQMYQPQAKLVFQVGNSWSHFPGVKNILSSTSPFPVGPGVNACFYHQEFDLDVYKYMPSPSPRIINSYIHYMQQVELFRQYQSLLPDHTMTSYGAGMDSVVHGTQNLANTMAGAGWTWHVKPGGDGYGHVLHNSYACGRPAIIKANYYQGQAGAALLEDLVTCIDISKRSVNENVSLIQEYSQPDRHAKMCQDAYDRFREAVDFDQEEITIRKFLDNLQ